MAAKRRCAAKRPDASRPEGRALLPHFLAADINELFEFRMQKIAVLTLTRLQEIEHECTPNSS